MTITEFSVNTFWKGEVAVRGTVEDDNEICSTKIYVKGSQVYDYSCSCARGSSYKGMCSHCKALLEEYLKREHAGGRKYVSTSPAVRLMIKEYTNREVAKIMGEEEAEKVSLIPKLLIGRDSVKLECMIGRKRLYQVRDLSAFAQAVENGQMVEYGKGLAFHHSVGAFEPESRLLVRLVTELASAYREYHSQMRGRTESVIPAFKYLTLYKTGCDRFFAISRGKQIEIEDVKGQKREISVLQGNPPVSVTVKQEGDNGIRVSVLNHIMVFSGETRLYVIYEDGLYRCDATYTEALSILLNQLVAAPGAAHSVTVNKKDIPLFYERVLRPLETLGILKEDGTDLEQFRPEKLKVRFEFDSIRNGEISLNPILSYGDFSFHPLEDDKVSNLICRDVPGEFRISQIITKYFKYREDGTKNLIIREDEEAVYRLLNEGVTQFLAIGEVYLSETFKKLKVLPPPSVSVGVSMAEGWLDLSVDVEGIDSSELQKILSEYSKKKKYYRMKSGEFLKLEDEGFSSISKLFEGLSLTKAELQEKNMRLENYRAFYVDSLVKEDTQITYHRDNRFKTVVRSMKSVEDSNFEIPAGLNGTLRAYQKTGFRWLKTLNEYGFGGILADDMGLGKTIQMICLLLDFAENGRENPLKPYRPSLVICPASLVYNWCHEFEVFAPSLKILSVTGTAAERREALTGIDGHDVVITSYDLLKRDLAIYKTHNFRCQVLDEAQYIKNASTQSARAVKSILAECRFALTGTPVENRLSELWSIFDFLMPGFLFSYRKFKTMFELPIVKDGDRSALANLHRMTGPFVLRRLKSDVLKELPDKLEKVLYSAFEGKQKDLYNGHALILKNSIENGTADTDGTGKIKILAELMKLRQICCDPSLCFEGYEDGSAKLETCMDLLSGAVESGHKVLLFSQFASMLEIIKKRLDAEQIPCFLLTGSTPKEERNRLVNAFHKEEVPVFLISLKAGGTGLNLTAADIVIHYDPWWNVAAQNQATDRAHRIGQNKQVTVYKLIMKQTIEENIMKLQAAKSSLAEQVVTEGTISLAAMGKDELLSILS